MKKKSDGVKLGLFVIGGVLLFSLGIYLIGQKQRMFSDVIEVSCYFKNAGGLQVGNNVRFSGINVGTVKNIGIVSDSSVKVDLVIDEDVKKFIKKDAKAMIGSEGLMGSKMISIIPGTEHDKPINDNDVISTIQPASLDDILDRLMTTTDNAAKITDDLSGITDNIRSGRGTIGKLFMDTIMADEIGQTLINLRKGTHGFEQNMSAARHSIFLRGAFRKKTDKNEEEKETTPKKKK
jgi:phospholipid/cholesterol/gamma-HCH transport system substrate-binding protein